MPRRRRYSNNKLDASRLSAYRIMWVFAMFDLPVNTTKEAKEANRFRKHLTKFGFTRLQYSVYVRHAPSTEVAEMHIRRIKNHLPEFGMVSMLIVTDRQFGNMIHYHCRKRVPGTDTPEQLTIFGGDGLPDTPIDQPTDE